MSRTNKSRKRPTKGISSEMAAIAGDMHLLAYLIASEIAFGGEPRAQDVAEYRQVLHRLFRQIELEGQQGVRS